MGQVVVEFKMKKITIFLIFGCILNLSSLCAEKVAVLSELMKPERMVIAGDRLYITDRTSIYIYSTKDYKLLKQFGQWGDGPGEFKLDDTGGPGLVIHPYPDRLLVNSMRKVSYFTLEGKFIEEVKVPPWLYFIPVKDNFVSTAVVMRPKDNSRRFVLSIRLFNTKFEPIKYLHFTEIAVGGRDIRTIPHDPLTFNIYKDKIYIPTGIDDFVIEVFDGNGEKLYSIKKDFKRIEVSEAFKKKALYWYQYLAPTKRYWAQMKNKIKFKKYFPAIKDIAVDNDKLYIFTHNTAAGGLRECIIMDLKGNERKRVFLPFPEVLPLQSLCYAINNNHIHTLKEIPDNEIWELYVTKIE